MNVQYAYSPLSNQENVIRIAIIQPGAEDDPICIKFGPRLLSVSCKPRSAAAIVFAVF